jgi:hypothetical protein
MFIDNVCRNLLRETPLDGEGCYGTRIFSVNNKEDFLVGIQKRC